MNLVAIGIMAVATWMGAFGAFYLKKGSEKFSFKTIFTNYTFILGGSLYVLSIPVYLFVLNMLPVSVAYSMTSMTYIWSAFLATTFLNERVTRLRWLGIGFIILGIVLVSL